MGITAFSFIVLPLCLLWAFNPLRLFQLLFVAGVFEAAAAITLGGLGVQPGLVPALALIGYVMLQLALGAQYPGQRRALRLCGPLLLVGAWAIAASMLLPHLFRDQVYVWPQKSTPPFRIALLEPSASNINQDLYLVVNLLLLTLGAMILTKSDAIRVGAFKAYLISGFVAFAVAVWQLLSKVAHLPYPDALFYSNPGWSILTGQSMGAIPRINGSFAEPSSLGSYMAACTCCAGWLILCGHRQALLKPLFVTGIAGVLMSTSTTGIASLAIAAGGLALGGLMSGSTRMLRKLLRFGVPLLVGVGVLGAVALVLAPGAYDVLGQIFSATLNKQSSASYDERTSTDLDNLQAALDTWGLGVGWGSSRSSSLIPGLLAGIGVPGMVGLLIFGVRLGRQVGAAKRRGCTPGQHFVMDGSAAALVGYLIPACLSAPTISSVSFFALLALLVGACAAAGSAVAQPGWVWYEGSDEAEALLPDGASEAAARNEATPISD